MDTNTTASTSTTNKINDGGKTNANETVNVLVVAEKPKMAKIIATALSNDKIGGNGDGGERKRRQKYFTGFLIYILTQIYILRQSDVYISAATASKNDKKIRKYR